MTFVEGDGVRDYDTASPCSVFFPYNEASDERELSSDELNYLWSTCTNLRMRKMFGKTPEEKGMRFFDFMFFSGERFVSPFLITFAEVATHNHFVLDRGGKVFKQTAPVIKLPAEATEDDHLRLLGLLNSGTGCFWMKQVFHKKTQMGGGGGSAKAPFSHQYQFDGTKLKQFPVVEVDDLTLVKAIQKSAEAMAANGPEQALEGWAAGGGCLREQLAAAEELCALHRGRLIYWQEELDWQVYERYGLIDRRDELALHGDAAVDTLSDRGLSLGERTFEIFMARQMARGTFETTWFERHAEAGSRPITAPPEDWPEAYVALYHRRHDAIQQNKNLNLIERPEFKRRWNTEPWAKRQQEALRQWLLARLEGYFFEGDRVCPPDDESARAARTFTAATRPQLVSANQLADIVQSDARFLDAAEIYAGASGFSVPKLVRDLVAAESVPYLPILRYKDSGLRKRHDWEETLGPPAPRRRGRERNQRPESRDQRGRVETQDPPGPAGAGRRHPRAAEVQLQGFPQVQLLEAPRQARRAQGALDQLPRCRARRRRLPDPRLGRLGPTPASPGPLRIPHRRQGEPRLAPRAPQAPPRRPRRHHPLAQAVAQYPRPQPRHGPRRLLRRLP